jgi:hypothetical protein
MKRTASPLILASIWFFAACASAPPSAPMAAPAPAVVDTVVVVETDGIQPIEPGRFDMGKMWTFENAPTAYFTEEYGFDADAEWLERVRMATLRLPNCTASFVSADGLAATNHHCARDAVSAVSRDGENLLDDGFYAASLEEERRAEEVLVDQLYSATDVTDLIVRAVDPTATDDVQLAAIDARTESVGDSASDANGLQCSVTSLYQGGKYSLYCYKRFSDVRVVFAPELQIGYFGGDADNFTYPRYNLDFSFFRIYDENGEPLQPAHYFQWAEYAPEEGAPTFVIGNPGSTERLNTFAQFEFNRDIQDPFIARLLRTRTDILAMYMDHHPEERSTYINQWFGLMNTLKLYDGRVRALNDPEIMGRKLGFEQEFRARVQANAALRAEFGTIWDEIADLRAQMREVYPTLMAMAQGGSVRSATLSTAQGMLQYAQAKQAGAPDSALASLVENIQGAEINTDLDAHMLAAQIGDVETLLGEEDAWVQEALAGRSPEEAARAIVAESQTIVDPELRAAAMADPASIMSAADPAFALARQAMMRQQQVGGPFQQLNQQEESLNRQVALALFRVYGDAIPPDATFTLRLQDGVVASYEYNGTKAPAWTTFYGMYDRAAAHKGREEWLLPDRWMNPPAEFDLSTPVNMVHTNDTVGGNSGSPVVTPELEIVGLLFDGNIESLSGQFIYTTNKARSVSVLSVGILEALEHIYGADRLVAELKGN